MTALLVGVFTVSGIHTLLWLPKALEMRRELRAEEAREAANQSGSAPNGGPADSKDGNHAG